jgi:hypothetical protein
MVPGSGYIDPSPNTRVVIEGRTVIATIAAGSDEIVTYRSAAARLCLDAEKLTADSHDVMVGVSPSARKYACRVVAPVAIGHALTIRNMPVDRVDKHA